MSKLLYVYNRHQAFDEMVSAKLSHVCQNLVPDNITSAPTHTIRVSGNTAYAVAMTTPLLRECGLSLMLGYLFEPRDVPWHLPSTDFPDGNFAIVRASTEALEVVSDAAASRTLWYYLDDSVFATSTSQRALVMYLESYAFDARVIPWMLSTGTLGPELSWDERFKRVPPDSSITLDKARWTLTVKSKPIVVSPERLTKTRFRARLTDAMRTTMRALDDIEHDRWVLTLSGGYDSRAIACFMNGDTRRANGFKAVTWGLAESLTERGNDARIAADLAAALSMRHEYHHTDVSHEPVETIIDRFIACGEGRIDHIAGYMDGLEIWRRLHDAGVCGIIRGDEGCGSESVSSEGTMRKLIEFGRCADFDNLKTVIEEYGFPPQEIPAELERQRGESLPAWRDRLFHQYRLPTGFAALSDIKNSYVETINPLLSKAILSAVRILPDALRTEKALFREIVRHASPAIPFATNRAIAYSEDVLKSAAVVNLMRQELGSAYARETLGAEFLEHVVRGLKPAEDQFSEPSKRSQIIRRARSLVPRRVKNWLSDHARPPRLDGNVLAFRVFIILRMHRLLSSHASSTPGTVRSRPGQPARAP